jgi:hypothetical protein
MIYLPDVNVWIALTSDQHVHHPLANQWIETLNADKLAFCRVTELGFLRLLTNAHVMGASVLKAAQALNIYDTLHADQRIVFVTEQPGFSSHWRKIADSISGGPNAWTDAYLAALASFERITIATFDRRFRPLGDCSVLALPSK